MNVRRSAQALAMVGAMTGALIAPTALALEVVASITPVHSVVARVMEGVGEPRLLTPPGASPHGFSLRPSDAQALDRADVVFWVDETLETFLTRPISALAADAIVVELAKSEGLDLFPYREGGPWEGHEEGGAEDAHGHGHDHRHDHGHGDFDAHVWLDPQNAKKMAAEIAGTLAAADPANADAYSRNAQAFGEEMDALTADLTADLAPVKGKAFIVFHDAYQYFEQRFGLNIVGSVTVNPDIAPSAKRLEEIRARLSESGVACVFSEPQFDQRLAQVVVDGSTAKIATLDPLGAFLTPGPGLYPQLLRDMSRAIRSCVAA